MKMKRNFQGIRRVLLVVITICSLFLSAGYLADKKSHPKEKPNVLVIAIDDLRPQLNCYGSDHIISPNIDKLASEGLLFEKAYCQQAVCLPSRISLFSGLRPPSTGVLNLQTNFRETIPDVTLLSQHFRNNGYYAVGMGKVLHSEEASVWDEWINITKLEGYQSTTYHNPETKEKIKQLWEEAMAKGLKGKAFRVFTKGPAVESYDAPANEYHDGKMTEVAIQKLNEVKDRQFFMTIGYKKPHLAFVAPEKYFDLYKREELVLADNPFPIKDAPSYAGSSWGELRAYNDIPATGPVDDAKARELIHGYNACVSFVDDQIGRVLKELRRLGLDKNTIIVLWGDHGWKLGEHGMWAKHTNYELDTHVPLIISWPGHHKPGMRSEALVEYVDIYPTLCELTGLPIPDICEGQSFAPLLDDPDLDWKKAAFSYYPRGDKLGYAIKTDRYRFVEWKIKATGQADSYELYDHQKDPRENVNLANKPEYKAIVEDHVSIIAKGWKGALAQ